MMGAAILPAVLAQAAPAAQESRCAALVGMTVPAGTIGLPTGGAAVTRAAIEGIAGDRVPPCVAIGEIAAVRPGSPPIRFRVNLPARWNDKAVQVGGGGYDGTLVTARAPFLLPDAGEPVRLGYATFGSDSGHSGAGDDASFALDAEARANFAYAQIKKTRDVAAAVIARFYGRAARRTYFTGNSQGGHEALLAAQRFPADYDGVIAIHPAYNFTRLQLGGLAVGRSLYGAAGRWLSPAQTAAIGRAVEARCDALDGLADGVVGNVAGCRAAFRVETLACAASPTPDPCLSPAQLAAVREIARPSHFGMTIDGAATFPGWPILDGAFATPTRFGFGRRPVPAVPPTGDDAFVYRMADQGVRYLMLRDPAVRSLTFAPARAAAAVRETAALVDASTPDLDAFRARGGKLLLMHGTVDMAIPPDNSVAYWRLLRGRYGRGLDGFARFYLAPGFGHGDGAFQLRWDSLAALDAWVEGAAPGPQTITDARAETTGRTRPLCEWPAFPRYRGGDAARAGSFACSMR